MDLESTSRDDDPFGPPAIPTLVACLHCSEEYESFLIEWRVLTGHDGNSDGFWCCPTPGCDGKGFGFDIFPVDRDYQDERVQWFDDEDEDDESEFDPLLNNPDDPDEDFLEQIEPEDLLDLDLERPPRPPKPADDDD